MKFQHYIAAAAIAGIVAFAIAVRDADVKQMQQQDLERAIAAAERLMPPDTEAARCYRALLDEVKRSLPIGALATTACEDVSLRAARAMNDLLRELIQQGPSLALLVRSL